MHLELDAPVGLRPKLGHLVREEVSYIGTLAIDWNAKSKIDPI